VPEVRETGCYDDGPRLDSAASARNAAGGRRIGDAPRAVKLDTSGDSETDVPMMI
jgi:hypothetical protein